MAGASDQAIFDMIRATDCYQDLDSRDRRKVELALNNQPSTRPSSWIARAAWELAKRETVGPPPPPPPPVFVKVAPITVREEGGSDQRVCLFTGEVEGGPLRPGVVKLPDGRYTDESRAVYQSNGLEDTSIRTKVHDTRLVGARSMDNRNACQCPPVGEPEKNTGSWTI